MPSNVLSTMAARAKAHHESMNAAYQATYSMGTSTPSASSPATSRKSSTTSVSPQPPPSDRNITKAWNALKKHHQEMNQAYTVFYSQGMATPPAASSSRTSSVAQTPKPSFEEKSMRAVDDDELLQLKPRNIEKVWNALKTRALEHHRSVNNASAAVYGA